MEAMNKRVSSVSLFTLLLVLISVQVNAFFPFGYESQFAQNSVETQNFPSNFDQVYEPQSQYFHQVNPEESSLFSQSYIPHDSFESTDPPFETQQIPFELNTNHRIKSPPPSPAPSLVEVPSPAPLSVEMPSPGPSPVEVPSPAPTPVEVPLPALSPVEFPSPTSSPVEVPSPTSSPVEVPSPALSPVQVPSPAPSSAEVPLPALSPVEFPLPALSPIEMPSPALSPVEAPSLASSSVEVPLPALSLVEFPSPAPSPVEVSSPAASPVELSTPKASPVKVPSPAPSPVEAPHSPKLHPAKACKLKCPAKCQKQEIPFLHHLCNKVCRLRCLYRYSKFMYTCTDRCAEFRPDNFKSDDKKEAVYVKYCYKKCFKNF